MEKVYKGSLSWPNLPYKERTIWLLDKYLPISPLLKRISTNKDTRIDNWNILIPLLNLFHPIKREVVCIYREILKLCHVIYVSPYDIKRNANFLVVL